MSYPPSVRGVEGALKVDVFGIAGSATRRGCSQLAGVGVGRPGRGDLDAAEEAAQGSGGPLRRLLRKEVTGVQRVAPDVLAPPPPKRERPALPFVPGAQRSFRAPQGQERTSYPAPIRTVPRSCSRSTVAAARYSSQMAWAWM